MSEIKDFGNKIGGAKKELWKSRGLMIDDVLDMNDIERNQYIKKDNVWQKPNYQAMVDSGLSKRIVYFIKTIRDGLPAKPQGNTTEYQDGYINFISDIRDKTMSIKSEAEILNYFDNVMKNYTEYKGYCYRPLPSTYGCINNKVFKAAQRNLVSLDREIKKKQFLYTNDEKILAKYSFLKYQNVTWSTDYNNRPCIEIKNGFSTTYIYPQNDYSVEANWKPNTYFVFDTHHNIILNNISSLDEAKQLVLEAEKQIETTSKPSNRKKKFIPKQLQHIKRVGDNYRNSHNITTDDMLNIFNFFGGEFGNWLNEKDKQQNLNYSYDAFVDLAKALNISNTDITFNNELSIAYGARGNPGAAAHYEPGRMVINLTKMSGAGSLAHEWGHALDHYLSRCFNCNVIFLTNTNNEIIQPLLEAMKYKIVDGEDAKKIHQQMYDYYKNKNLSIIKSACYYNKLTDEQKKIIDDCIENCLNHHISYEDFSLSNIDNKDNTPIQELSEKVNQFTGRPVSKDNRQYIKLVQYTLSEKLKKFNEPLKVETDYYRNAKLLDGVYSKDDKRYWHSSEEMFARAFACYVKDKLSPNRSDYLCGHAESCSCFVDGIKVKAYPEGIERKNINNCFDKLIELAKNKGLFAEYNQENVVFNYHLDKENFEDKSINENIEQLSFTDLNFPDTEIDIEENY